MIKYSSSLRKKSKYINKRKLIGGASGTISQVPTDYPMGFYYVIKNNIPDDFTLTNRGKPIRNKISVHTGDIVFSKTDARIPGYMLIEIQITDEVSSDSNSGGIGWIHKNYIGFLGEKNTPPPGPPPHHSEFPIGFYYYVNGNVTLRQNNDNADIITVFTKELTFGKTQVENGELVFSNTDYRRLNPNHLVEIMSTGIGGDGISGKIGWIENKNLEFAGSHAPYNDPRLQALGQIPQAKASPAQAWRLSPTPGLIPQAKPSRPKLFPTAGAKPSRPKLFPTAGAKPSGAKPSGAKPSRWLSRPKLVSPPSPDQTWRLSPTAGAKPSRPKSKKLSKGEINTLNKLGIRDIYMSLSKEQQNSIMRRDPTNRLNKRLPPSFNNKIYHKSGKILKTPRRAARCDVTLGTCGKPTILYHATTYDFAERIIGDDLKRGRQGWVGPGMYFCTDPCECTKKARAGPPGGDAPKDGWAMLVCLVILGETQHIDASTADYGEDHTSSLERRGYDSIHLYNIPTMTGDEYIVYNNDQVIVLGTIQQIIDGKVIPPPTINMTSEDIISSITRTVIDAQRRGFPDKCK
jgi:hypothetical protein